jgi:ferritin-like metal-binding protein YciE
MNIAVASIELLPLRSRPVSLFSLMKGSIMNKDLHKLFLHTVKDVYFAENAITKALPKMIKAAQGEELKAAFETHLEQTKGQIQRLEQVFGLLKEKPEAIPCEAIKGILKEGDEVAEEFKGNSALDQGLIAAAQAVEHYEIARYGALHAWATEMGHDDVADLLEMTLNEEKATDELLTDLAEGSMPTAKAA